MSEVINIYTDGACKNNPGPGGWAAVILTPHGTNLTVRGRDPTSTNNRMELTAAIKGLYELDHLIPKPWDVPVILHSDSKYLTDAFNENWLGKWKKNGWNTSKGTPVSNPDLWGELLLLAEQRNITWQWVKGHSGNYFNEICDQIATEEAQMAKEEAETAAQPARGRAGGPVEAETSQLPNNSRRISPKVLDKHARGERNAATCNLHNHRDSGPGRLWWLRRIIPGPQPYGRVQRKKSPGRARQTLQ